MTRPKPLRSYTVEIYAPPYDGRPLGARPSRRMRVHCGTFEQNRDSLSPECILTRELQAPTKEDARERGREFLRDYNRRWPTRQEG